MEKHFFVISDQKDIGQYLIWTAKLKKKFNKNLINGYATVDEISFVDDYHILTLGKPFTKEKNRIL